MNNPESGLQPERTALSWQRTAWAMLILSLLCLRGWLHDGQWLYGLCGGLLLTGIIVTHCHFPRNKPAIISLIVTLCGGLLIIMTVEKYFLLPG